MTKSSSFANQLTGSVLTTASEGYVFDQMEGAVDTALFLALLDIPVAIVGPRGTGKGFISRLIHDTRAGDESEYTFLDCREFKGKAPSLRIILQTLESDVLKTIVFKSPHLLQKKVQEMLARSIASRTLTLKRPVTYLSEFKFVALFPQPLERLVKEGVLDPNLASCFSAYPIMVPALSERGHAVLRWADKILLQESKNINRVIKGFSPDAQQAMLGHSWTGNISELRQRIIDALESTKRDWLMPVDLGLKKMPTRRLIIDETSGSVFEEIDKIIASDENFSLTALQELELAIRGWSENLDCKNPEPLGLWLHDELVLAAIDRYKGNHPKAASWLQVPSRNVRRWIPSINKRGSERLSSKNARDHSRLVREWVRETPREGPPPGVMLEEILLRETLRLKEKFDLAARAAFLGVSVPTYRKKRGEYEKKLPSNPNDKDQK